MKTRKWDVWQKSYLTSGILNFLVTDSIHETQLIKSRVNRKYQYSRLLNYDKQS